MSNDKEPVQDNADEQAASEAGREAQASAKAEGEAGIKSASDEKGTAGEGLFDGMTPETLHKSYKQLQGEYSRLQNDIVKKFEPYGGAEQVLQWTDYLSKNPDFAQWIAQQKTKTTLGIDESQLDDQTKTALDAVRKIARAVVTEEVNRIRTNEIAPLNEAAKQSLINSHFEQMDRLYGDDWHEMRDLMSELSENLPMDTQDRPKFDDVEDLYFKALRKSGKLENYAANKLKKQIDTKKAKATDKPTTAGTSTPTKARTMAEAFAQAKSAQG